MGHRKKAPPRREVSAEVKRASIKPIFVQADRDLIQCTRQPGGLRISTYACGRRYLLAQNKGSKGAYDDFGAALRWGLEICGTCSQGREYAEALDNKPVVGRKKGETLSQTKAKDHRGPHHRH